MKPDPSVPEGADPSSSRDHDLIISFRDAPVRYVMIDGVPWFALPDLCEAAGFHPCSVQVVDRPDFPTHAVQTLSAEDENGAACEIPVVTAVGAYWFTALTDPGRGQAIAAWTRREALRMCPDAERDNAALFLTLSPTGDLPPRPYRYTGRKTEWEDLRASPEYMQLNMYKRRDLQARLLQEAQRKYEEWAG